MSNIATTISQSRKLIELGLDPKTADMSWYKVNVMYPYELHTLYKGHGVMADGSDELIPAWSLSALLEVMRKLNATITLQIIGNSTFLRIKDNGFMWQKDIHVKNPMDAVYGGMLWLLEQGLIKKGDNND